MSPTFVKYQNAVDIGSLGPLNTWNAIDLVGLYDSDAIGLTLMITTTIELQDRIGVAEIGADAVIKETPLIILSNWSEIAISLRGASSIQVRPSFAGGEVMITGEIHGTHAVLHDDVIIQDIVEAQFDLWQQHTVTVLGGDAVGDVKGVIIRSLQRDTGRRGVRELGSTTANSVIQEGQGHTWHVVGVDDDGVYETYSSGKATTDREAHIMQEVGYILKTSDVVTVLNPLDTDLNVTLADSGYVTRNARRNRTIPSLGTFVLGFRWVNTVSAGAVYSAFARQPDSTDDDDGLLGGFGTRGPHTQNQVVAVDSLIGLLGETEIQFEYRLSDVGINLYIDWYESPRPADCDFFAHILGSTAEEHVEPPQSDKVPATFHFHDTTDDLNFSLFFDDRERTWDFGDGSDPHPFGIKSRFQVFWHTYTEYGLYTVTLTVCNTTGCAPTCVRTRYVRVQQGHGAVLGSISEPKKLSFDLNTRSPVQKTRLTEELNVSIKRLSTEPRMDEVLN